MAAATRKLNELSQKAATTTATHAAPISADVAPAPAAPARELHELGGPSAEQLPAVRNRNPTNLFEPSEKLRDFATGSHKRKGLCTEQCTKKACVEARAERDDAVARLKPSTFLTCTRTMPPSAEAFLAAAAFTAASASAIAASASASLAAACAFASPAALAASSFWLALIMSEAFPVTEDTVHQSAEYEAGFLVVKAKHYSLEQRSPRGYVLKDEEWTLDVNAVM